MAINGGDPVVELTQKAASDIMPEKDRAEMHKARLRELFAPVVAEMETARADGFLTEFQIAFDAYGRYSVTSISLVKRF